MIEEDICMQCGEKMDIYYIDSTQWIWFCPGCEDADDYD